MTMLLVPDVPMMVDQMEGKEDYLMNILFLVEYDKQFYFVVCNSRSSNARKRENDLIDRMKIFRSYQCVEFG